MFKTVIEIDGMSCPMCEAHINDVIRNTFKGVKVKSSFRKGTAEVISKEELPEKMLSEAVEKTGYKVLEITACPFEKRTFFR